MDYLLIALGLVFGLVGLSWLFHKLTTKGPPDAP